MVEGEPIGIEWLSVHCPITGEQCVLGSKQGDDPSDASIDSYIGRLKVIRKSCALLVMNCDPAGCEIGRALKNEVLLHDVIHKLLLSNGYIIAPGGKALNLRGKNC